MEKLRQWYEERIKLAEPMVDFRKLRDTRDSYLAEREKLYRTVFRHRDRDPDELTQIRLGELSAQIEAQERRLDSLEHQSPEFAARLSFERMVEYNDQLRTEGFAWTPSREQHFEKMIEYLVIFNQNRPLLLVGETGTGKTALARNASRRLVGRSPLEVGEEAKSDIRPLLGSKAIDGEGSYIHYGQLGQALTGKETSRSTEPGPGGIFYMDEMNGYPPDALRSLIKQISGRRPGEAITFAAWAGRVERLSSEFGFIGSANLPSEKHPDRSDLPIEVARELGEIEIGYQPQTPENPELYELLTAGLMDQNGRLRLPAEELAPEYEDVVDATTNVKRQELKTQPEAGGTLWRFANLMADIQRSYTGQANALTPTEREASYLRAAVLDTGLVLSWLGAYRKALHSMRRQSLTEFLTHQLHEWAGRKGLPSEDRVLLGKFLQAYRLDESVDSIHTEGGHRFLTPQEIGALSPRVPREAETLKEAPKPVEASKFLADGTEVVYSPEQTGGRSQWMKKGDRSKRPWRMLGVGKGAHQGKVVMEGEAGIELVDQRVLRREWAAASLTFAERFEGKEIKLDVTETRRVSEEFYEEHDLYDFVDNLPKEIRFSPEGEARIREALKMGFDKAMILPQAELQGRSINAVIEQMAKKPHTGLSAPDQYGDPYIAEGTKQSQTRNRPVKAYMLMYQSRPVPSETKGKTPDQLETLFQQKKWNGLTMSEYLLLQRRELEEHNNHSFDAYDDDATKSQWSWLLDSRVSSSGVADAHWDPRGRRVSVSWSDAGRSGPGLGARPAVVVEIL
ncbi:MAG: AAA family ATPase [Patescibacteria group bacterium]